MQNIIAEITERIAKVRQLNPNKKIGFMLGNTISLDPHAKAYATPVRDCGDIVILGAIVFNQIDAIVLAKKFNFDVDKFFVDIEKKIPIDFEPNLSLASHFDININDDNSPQFGNISAAVRPFVPVEKFIGYKANDITVDAVWFFVSSFFGELSGKKIFIQGLGNIGSKLALKFVESGMSVSIISNNYERDSQITMSLNRIKNKSVLASVALVENKEFELINADLVVLATDVGGVFSKDDAKFSIKTSLVIDIGKGNLTEEALSEFTRRSVPVWRADISEYLPVVISGFDRLSTYCNKNFGRNKISEFFVVSGGFIGKKYDLIVDNLENPKFVYGVCDGLGGIIRDGDKKALKLIQNFKLNYLNSVS